MALTHDIQPLGTHRCLLGESPLWHPDEAQLYCVDIPGRQVLRWRAGPDTRLTYEGEFQRTERRGWSNGLLAVPGVADLPFSTTLSEPWTWLNNTNNRCIRNNAVSQCINTIVIVEII